MKFEDLLMQQGEDKQANKLHLQEQVERLEEELEGELELKRVLQCTMQGPSGCCDSCSSLTPFLPFQVQMLLADLAVVEEEIDWVERKINELKLDIHHEKQKRKEMEVVQLKEFRPKLEQRQLRKLPSRRPNQIQHKESDALSTSQNYENRRYRIPGDRRASLGSSKELQSATFTGKHGKPEFPVAPSRTPTFLSNSSAESEAVNPNKLSVDLIKCLIGIFLKLHHTAFKSTRLTSLSKQTMACMNSKGLVSKAAFSCKTPVFPFNDDASHLDPYDILPRDTGPYKNFIQITKGTLDTSRFSECIPDVQRLRILMQKLNKVKVNHFSHKQKLAFWINIYNASIMNAFLQHGLPSTQEKLLLLMNEAEINVGGFIFKASTIEQCILRHPAEAKYDLTEEKEIILRQACGLDYPEPNVIFALCRGNWSSPALRFYMPDEVMNELEKAKVEYLEASVGITSKKKISVPKLVHRHMKDFADDIESLLEWIYSQLPLTSSLKRLMMECLNGETDQSPSQKLIEIQPYVFEFRYLIPTY
ncbi:uncharacterized protein LOC131005891 [Salvia miltiorrhiza]|uniref:uncharacterized protein LOC131005891 n=1 Tax=Salvia miltiorrhiza TaxID=226208 RepID=UPI0025AC3D18|nr:uncharacterized protein LOC131005891 [Salvia miltiorrhiza]